MKKATWIILTWNSQKVIEPCISSIVHISSIHSRIIVIDNGSADDTLELVKKVKAENISSTIQIELVELEKNLGTAVSRNIGLRMVDSDCDYICILDSDTVVNEEAVGQLISHLDIDPKCGIVGPRMATSAGVEQLSGRNIPTAKVKLYKGLPIKKLQRKGELLEIPNGRNSETPYEVGYLMSACWMFRPALLSDVGLLDEKFFMLRKMLNTAYAFGGKDIRSFFAQRL